jgi:hypothetical protein
MTDQEFTAGSLERALGALGLDELAARLDAPAQLVQTWMRGQQAMPERNFMLLLDLLLDISPSDPHPG